VGQRQHFIKITGGIITNAILTAMKAQKRHVASVTVVMVGAFSG
jgi:hypothetical protein